MLSNIQGQSRGVRISGGGSGDEKEVNRGTAIEKFEKN